jgi:hypothetical protein
MTLEFSTRFSKNTQIPTVINVRSVDADFFLYGQTERHEEANIRVCNFMNAPKNGHPKTKKDIRAHIFAHPEILIQIIRVYKYKILLF